MAMNCRHRLEYKPSRNTWNPEPRIPQIDLKLTRLNVLRDLFIHWEYNGRDYTPDPRQTRWHVRCTGNCFNNGMIAP
jgi:hypothetical protein